jgi:hypothetical protein
MLQLHLLLATLQYSQEAKKENKSTLVECTSYEGYIVVDFFNKPGYFLGSLRRLRQLEVKQNYLPMACHPCQPLPTIKGFTGAVMLGYIEAVCASIPEL